MVGSRGVVLSAAALLAALLSGCAADPVAVDAPDLSASDAASCRDLVDALPEEVDGHEWREVSGGPGVAWGEPAIVLTCGVPRSTGFTDTATCIEVNGTGWFVPDDVLLSDDQTLDVTMTAVGVRPRVEVFLPGGYRPDGFPNTAGAIGEVVADRLEEVRSCR